MPIQVTCPGCHTRFKVADQHGGKEGACPKCKGQIKVPKLSEQVVVHAPEHSEKGAKDAKGRPVLKPVRRKDTKFQPLVFVGALLTIATVFGVAWVLRGQAPTAVVALGAALLGPPIAWAGYAFLRDPELEGYAGGNLWIRSIICGLVYALLWGVFVFVKTRFWGDAPLEYYQILVLAAPLLGIGAFTAVVSLDLELGNGFFHYALYLMFTILLALTLGLDLMQGTQTKDANPRSAAAATKVAKIQYSVHRRAGDVSPMVAQR